MYQLDDQFLQDLGLGALPEDQKQALLQQFMETLELRVGIKLSEGLSEQQLKDFELLTPAEGDTPELEQQKQVAAMQWLQSNRPQYKDVVMGELEALKQEIIAGRDQILGAA
jgi:hypothetical protein